MKAGRQINLSSWDTYSVDQQQILKAKIMQEAKSRKMPLPQYRMTHWNTRITDADLRAFAQWTREMPARKRGGHRQSGRATRYEVKRSSRSGAPAAMRWSKIEKDQD